MPSRLLREGILDSDRVEKLSLGAEIFYRRLMSVVDDYGLFDGRISVLKSRLYPLRHQRVPDRDLSKWLLECESAGLIRRYTVDDKPYVEFFDLKSPRHSKPKYPQPPNGPPSAHNGLRLETGAPLYGGEVRSRAGAPPENAFARKKSRRRDKLDAASGG